MSEQLDRHTQQNKLGFKGTFASDISFDDKGAGGLGFPWLSKHYSDYSEYPEYSEYSEHSKYSEASEFSEHKYWNTIKC